MKLCYLDAFSGISGDMTVGALIDAGAESKALVQSLEALGTGAKFEVEKTKRRGIAASKFRVIGGDNTTHRHLKYILEIIEKSGISKRAKQNASAVFQRLGEAEAKVHDVSIDKVHFHEVGAVDSICDIVGACVALDLLGVSEVHCSRINVGSGTVETEHGTLPVPAPATTELLIGKPVYAAGPVTELTTPTGAALLSTLATGFGAMPPMRVLAQGFGAGDKDFPMQANVLRVLIGQHTAATESTTVSVIEANIDDSTPQVLGYAMERLLGEGALDVTLSPLFMKKNRPATLLSVICAPDRAEDLAAIVFAETSTLGMRIHQAERRVLARTISEVETPYGKIHVKHAQNGTYTPEFDDCRRAAIEHNVPLRTVISAAVKK